LADCFDVFYKNTTIIQYKTAESSNNKRHQKAEDKSFRRRLQEEIKMGAEKRAVSNSEFQEDFIF
jgi:hypothetical protein